MAYREEFSNPKTSRKDPQYFCDACKEGFDFRPDWNAHKMTMEHRRKTYNFQKVLCDICKIEFSSKAELKEHETLLSHRKLKEQFEIRLQEQEKNLPLRSLQDILKENEELRSTKANLSRRLIALANAKEHCELNHQEFYN